MHDHHIGKAVFLRSAPKNVGTIVDFEVDDQGVPCSFPYLVEWADQSCSYHRAYEIDLVEVHATSEPVRRRLGLRLDPRVPRVPLPGHGRQ